MEPLRIAAASLGLLIALPLASAPASAQFVLVPPTGTGSVTGGFLQEGRHLPLPAVSGVFTGSSAATWPPLPIGAASNVTPAGATRTIQQGLSTPAGGAIAIPPAVLTHRADGVLDRVGVHPRKPSLFQVATTASFQWPSATATLRPAGAPGPTVTGVPGLNQGIVAYGGGTKAFGGPATFALRAGPGAGSHHLAPNPFGTLPIATLWLNGAGATPYSAMQAGLAAIASSFRPQQGAFFFAPSVTTSFGPVASGVRALNFPAGGAACTMWCVGASGTIVSSGPAAGPFPTNRQSFSKGWSFTTGLISISVPSATPAPEIFFLSGSDARSGGVGSISMVAASLSRRTLTGPSGNRAWVRLNLPEPHSLVGAACALATLALCRAWGRGSRA